MALILGITAAMYRGPLYDRVVNTLVVGIISVPEFMVATLAVLVFAVWLRWLPALSFASDVTGLLDVLRVYAMPVITLAVVISAQMIRMTRAAVIETLNMPYVEMALLKGASRAAHRAAPRPAQRGRADRQCRRPVAVLSGRRRHHRRDDLQLSRDRQADGRCRSHPRPAADPDLRDDLLPRLSRPHHRRRHRRDPVQPEARKTMAAVRSRPPAASATVSVPSASWPSGSSCSGPSSRSSRPWLTPYPRARSSTSTISAPCAGQFWLGTDYLGRDMLSRILDRRPLHRRHLARRGRPSPAPRAWCSA